MPVRRFLWILFLSADGVLVALFTAGYLAHYVRPHEFWWLEVAAVFLPYVSLGIVAAAIPLLLDRRRYLFALHALLILLIVIRLNPFPRVFTSVPEQDDDLTLMTFNVPQWWGYFMSAKTARMAELIERVDPDVIGLQEAYIAFYPDDPPRRAAPYVSVLYDSMGFETIGPRATGATYTPQPVFSRTELIESTQYSFRHDPEDDAESRVTRTRLMWQGREFALYNVHLRTFGEEKFWHEEELPFLKPRNLLPYLRRFRDSSRNRAHELDRLVAMLEAEELPVILVGDLNSTPHNWVAGRLTRMLRDAFRERGRGWGKTYHTRMPIVRIDYILVSEEWEVVSARVVDAYLSDHLPVVARLRWRE